jgi:uncharacterized protein (TIGR02246 family)
MMKYLIYLLGLFLACTACREANHTYMKTDAIEQEIRSMGNDVVQALNEANIDVLVRDFWQSDSTLFMIDGMKVQGYENIRSVMEEIPNRRKDLELEVEDEQVYVLSNNAAVHVIKFQEEVTHLDDSISEGEGLWNTVYKKMEGEWKIVMVHESHLKNRNN